MTPSTPRIFIDKAAERIASVRSSLVLYVGGTGDVNAFAGAASLLEQMTSEAAALGLDEIKRDLVSASDKLRTIGMDGEPGPRGAAAALDLIAQVEAGLLRSGLADDDFELDLDGFVNDSFSSLHNSQIVPDPASTSITGAQNFDLWSDVTVPEQIQFSDAGLDVAQADREDSWASEAGDEFEVDPELLEIFAEEAESLLQNMEASLEQLAGNQNDRDALWEIRRNAHTFKGSAGIVGLKQLSELAHRVEDLLDRLSESKSAANDRIFELLRESTTCLRALTAGENSPQLFHAISQLYYDFDGILALIARGEENVPVAQMDLVAEPISPSDLETGAIELIFDEAEVAASEDDRSLAELFELPVPDEAVPKTNQPKGVVRVSLSRLDELVAIIRDMIVNRSVFEQNIKQFERQIDDLHNATRRLQLSSTKLEIDFEASLLGSGSQLITHSDGPAATAREGFDELEFDRYTEFHQTTRELAETSSDAFSISASLDLLRGGFESVLEDQIRLIDEMQEKLMRIRMVEFNSLATRLQRAVRVTCEEEGKKAQIALRNQQLEIDTHIIDSMIEPLTHLLKNAVVHGIEEPETRRLLGKSEIGLVEVSVENEDTHIVLTVGDDGRGISPGVLRDKAVLMGLIARDDADALSDEEALELIFLPGLTTAEKLNLSAGRGVGMSIVKESIDAARGSITIESVPQKGTTFTVKIPIALAISKVFIVRSSGMLYALPSKQITYVFQLPDDIASDARTVRLSDKELPLALLTELLGNPGSPPAAGMTALLFESTDRSHVVAVDEVIRAEEVLIKPLLSPLDQIGGLLGAAVLGSGEAVPIADLQVLLKKKLRARAKAELLEKKPEPKFTVMIVDDSPSVRHMTSKVVQSAGWQVLTAKDGIDALEQLKAGSELPAVILSDIEMPRMDGYEFAASLQRSEEFNKIPVIMITSRTADKHREKALENGVSQYLTKPYQDRELIDSIKLLANVT